MIRLVWYRCYFDLIFYMKNNSPQPFYNGISGCLESINKVIDVREKTEMACADFTGIQKDSFVFIRFDCVEYQIWLIYWKRFINSLLELECFNLTKTAWALCSCYPWKNYLCKRNGLDLYVTVFKVFLFNSFHTLYLEYNPYMK